MADEKATPFESFAALRADHSRLLKARASKGPGANPPTKEEVLLFLARALATGRRLDAPAERESAQSAMDYWSATLCTLPDRTVRKAASSTGTGDGTVDMCVLLEPFDVATAKRVVADAEAWFLSLPPDDQATVRRVLMRLVVLSVDGKTFASKPASRSALDPFGPPERVEALLAALVEKPLVRLPPGATPTVALRYDASMREWPRLADWLDKRLRFRQAARYWRANGDAPAALIRDEPLDEAREYHDKDHLEERFIATSGSRAREQDRLFKGLIGIAFVFAVIAAGFFWWAKRTASAEQELRIRAETSKREAVERQNAVLLEDARSEGRSTLTLASILLQGGEASIHVATKVLIIHTLGHVAFAESEGSAAIARVNWQRLRAQLVSRDDWFKTDFLDEEENAEHIRHLTTTWPADEESVRAMLAVSRFFRDAIEETAAEGVYLKRLNRAKVKEVWYEQAIQAAEKLSAAANRGEPLTWSSPYSKAFWCLYTGELILVESAEVAAAMARFGNELREWERSKDGKAPADVAARLEHLAGALREACDAELETTRRSEEKRPP